MKTLSQKLPWWTTAVFTAAILVAAPAHAQRPSYAPLPEPPAMPSGGAQEMLAWQTQFNRWLASVGSAPGYSGQLSTGGGVQEALRRSQAIDRYVKQVGQAYRLPPAGPTTLEAKLNMSQEINRMSEPVLPSPLQGRERAIFLARLYYQTHEQTARQFEAHGDRHSAAVLRQRAAYYLAVFRQLGGQ